MALVKISELTAAANLTGTEVVPGVQSANTKKISALVNTHSAQSTIGNRIVADAVLNSTTTVTSATAAFSSTDKYAFVSATGIPDGTYIATVSSATQIILSTAATATASSVSLTISGGIKTFQGGIAVRGPRDIDIRAYGISPGGVINTAIVKAIAEAAASGARVVMDPTGNSEYIYSSTSQVTLPKTYGLTILGNARAGTRIVATSLPVGTPLFAWTTSVIGNTENQVFRDMRIDRQTDGPIFRHVQSVRTPPDPGATDPLLGDRIKARFENLHLVGVLNGNYPLLDMNYILSAKFRDLQFAGGSHGILVSGGSYGEFVNINIPLKSAAPRTFIEITGPTTVGPDFNVSTGGHILRNCRSEGGGYWAVNNDGSGALTTTYAFKFFGATTCSLYDCATEGANEDTQFLFEHCQNIIIDNPGIGVPEDVDPIHPNPRGMHFIDSQAVYMRGGHTTKFTDVLPSARTIDIDSTSVVEIDGLGITGNNPLTQLFNASTFSYGNLVAEDSTPEGAIFSFGTFPGGGMMGRGAMNFGSIDNSSVNVKQNNTTRATFNADNLTLDYQLRAKASLSSASSLRLPHGNAPTVPVNGDMWTTTAGLFVHINGVTVGPLS